MPKIPYPQNIDIRFRLEALSGKAIADRITWEDLDEAAKWLKRLVDENKKGNEIEEV